MKKIISLFLILLMLLPFAGCKNTGSNANGTSDNKTTKNEKEVQQTQKSEETKTTDAASSEKTNEQASSTSATTASSGTNPASTDTSKNNDQTKPSGNDTSKGNQQTKTPTGTVSNNNKSTQTTAQAKGSQVKKVSDDPIMAIGKLEFSLEDIAGDSYNSADIFKENKLTMINIWGTLCTPCIKELPELQALSIEFSDKEIGIIGIVGDVSGEDGLEDAKTIIGKKKIEYTNLIPNDKLTEVLISKINGYPVTIFVDSEGNLVGEPVIGARSKEEYKKIAEKVFSEI